MFQLLQALEEIAALLRELIRTNGGDDSPVRPAPTPYDAEADGGTQRTR
jgi:hypothetical protein